MKDQHARNLAQKALNRAEDAAEQARLALSGSRITINGFGEAERRDALRAIDQLHADLASMTASRDRAVAELSDTAPSRIDRDRLRDLGVLASNEGITSETWTKLLDKIDRLTGERNEAQRQALMHDERVENDRDAEKWRNLVNMFNGSVPSVNMFAASGIDQDRTVPSYARVKSRSALLDANGRARSQITIEWLGNGDEAAALEHVAAQIRQGNRG